MSRVARLGSDSVDRLRRRDSLSGRPVVGWCVGGVELLTETGLFRRRISISGCGHDTVGLESAGSKAPVVLLASDQQEAIVSSSPARCRFLFFVTGFAFGVGLGPDLFRENY